LNRAGEGGKPALNSGIEEFIQGLGIQSKVGGLDSQAVLAQNICRKLEIPESSPE